MDDMNAKAIHEQIERILKWRDESLIPAIQKTIDIIAPLIQEFINMGMPTIAKTYEEIINSYTDKRVVCLALRHKKERVRKKNMKRIFKGYKRRG